MRRIVAILLAVAFAGPVVAQGTTITQVGGIALTPEQQRILDALPPGQRAEILRQAQQFATQQGIDTTQESRPPQREAAERAPQEPSPGRINGPEERRTGIQPSDTLIVEILFPPRERARSAEPDAPREHLLRGRHVVQLDRFGRLSMPGIRDVPLAGLREEHAELRLMSEPALSDMVVYVTRLPLTPTGREALRPFGYNIFQRPLERLDPFRTVLGLPVPTDYVIGPGDSVQIFLFGKDTGRHHLVVTPDGYIEIPTLGPVAVAGMTFGAVKQLVERRIREETIGTQASVSMGDLRSIEVFVIGEVRDPGLHTISSMSTVVNALYDARGITEIGSLRDIRVFRGGEQIERLDLYSLLLQGDPRADIRLQSGDVVFVPPTGGRVGMMGEVLRPAWYELSERTRLGELLDHAGGSTPDGDLRLVQIERRGADGRIRYIDVDASTREGRATELRAHDVVSVARSSPTAADAVALHGHFESPGLRAWRAGLRLRDIINHPGMVRQDLDLDYGLLVRHVDDSHGIRVTMFSPREVLASDDAAGNVALQRRDEIYLFGFDEPVQRRALVDPLVERLRRQATADTGARIVHVAGAVRAPGAYPLADGMRLSDMTRAAGGIGESAFRGAAEVTRYDVRNGVQREIEHIEVDLDRVLARDRAVDLAVQAHDVLTVKQLPQWTERGTIELRGEVRFPGTYPIRPGETLAQVIERAGGLTDFAFPRAAVFTRETLREREQRQIDNMVRRLEADVAAAAAQQGPGGAQAQALAGSLLQQLRDTRAVGRLVIDLPRLIQSPGNPDIDVLVHDGDLLIVPQRPQEVTVLGEVYFPTSHIFEPGVRGESYLQRSGGMTHRADARRIYVVRANGAVETAAGRRGRVGIEPGDTIVVPLDAERLPPMVRIMNISQVLYQLAITAAALQTIGAL